MGILTDDMKTVVTNHTLGFVATVNADGTPNLSPKGTMAVIDDDHIGFGEMRSPTTVANMARHPVVEMNFVDVFARRGYRFKGPAAYITKGNDEFAALLPAFAKWEGLFDRFQGIVKVKVERALEITSPAYDAGATEDELKAQFKEHFLGLMP